MDTALKVFNNFNSTYNYYHLLIEKISTDWIFLFLTCH